MAKRDYYETLGLQKGAQNSEIKKAYKRLAKKFHPDISTDPKAEEKFKEVQEAYSVLSDSQKKQAYDSYGHGFKGFKGFQGFRNTGGFESFGADFDFSDIFNAFTGGGFSDVFGSQFRRESGPMRGSDIKVTLSVKFEEAAFGEEKEISIERTASCKKCKGKGYEKESDIETCQECKGQGRVTKTRRTMFGVFQTVSICPNCNGAGKYIKKNCRECGGTGIIKEKKKIKVKIPAGINSGNFLRLGGQGNAGSKGGLPGDIYVVIFVEPHEIFKRDGFDVYLELPLSFSEAALGSTIDAPTLHGNAELKVPTGTQSGTIFRLSGKGIQKLNASGKGDEFVKVILETPGKLSGRERELFEQLSEEEKTKKKRTGLFDKFHSELKKRFG